MDRFKFRVWDKRKNIYIKDFVFNFINKAPYITVEYFDNEYEYTHTFEEDEIIIEQCTGLKDKNGKLIYEGDIIELTRARNYGWIPRGSKLAIKWNTFDCCGFSTGIRGNLTKKCAENCIVVGNIHENADLLGE